MGSNGVHVYTEDAPAKSSTTSKSSKTSSSKSSSGSSSATAPSVSSTKTVEQSSPVNSSTGKSWQQINGTWTYADNAVKPEVKPAPAVYSSSAAKTDYAKNQEVLKKAETSLLDIYNSRPDVQAEMSKYQGNPTQQGTEANRKLNDWYNQYGKNEYAGTTLVQPVINKTGNIALDSKVAEINQTLSQPYTGTVIDAYNARPDVQEMIRNNYEGDPFTAGTSANRALNDWWNRTGSNEMSEMAKKQATAEYSQAQDELTTAIANARLAEDGGNLLAFRKAIEDVNAAQDKKIESINNLYENIKTTRNQVAQYSTPTAEETALKTEIANIAQQIKQTNLNAEAGIAKVNEQTIPQAFLSGQNAAIQKQANLALKTLNDSYSNLTNRLGLMEEDRQANLDSANQQLSFLYDDLEFQQKAYDRLYDEETDIISRFDKYSSETKSNAADALEALSGIDPSTMSEKAKEQVATIAENLGVDTADIMAALQNSWDQVILEAAQKATADTTIIERDGRQILINKTTGEDIKDLGKIYVAPKTSSGGGGLTEAEKKQAKYNDVVSQLQSSKGIDGYVNTEVYERLIKANPDLRSWLPAEEWLNPNDPTAKKFFQTAGQALNGSGRAR